MKISKIDAFSAAAVAIDIGDLKTANSILKILSNSIDKDKKDNTFSAYIEIQKKMKNFLKTFLNPEK